MLGPWISRLLKWSRTLWSLPPPMFFACLLFVETFSQRMSLIREMRNAKREGNCQRRPNNNNVVTKHSYGEGNGSPLQYSCLENPMDGGAWWAAVHRVAKSQTRLSDFTFTSHFPTLEKEMVTHSSVLAWRIPGTAEPGGLLSMGSHRVGHDWSDLAAAAASTVKDL